MERAEQYREISKLTGQPLVTEGDAAFMRETRRRRRDRQLLIAAKVAWIGADVVILGWWLQLQSQQRFEEQILVAFALNVLSFPSGLLFWLLFAGTCELMELLSLGSPGGYSEIVSLWIGLFLAGYLQWFKLLPFLFAKFGGSTRSVDGPRGKN